MTNKADGCVYKNQNRFEIIGDVGNEYDFKPEGETVMLNGDNATVTLVEKDEIKAIYSICVPAEGISVCSTVTVYADKSDEIIVRLYNPLQETAKISAKNAFVQTNLAETEDGEAVTEIDVASKKIVTLKIN